MTKILISLIALSVIIATYPVGKRVVESFSSSSETSVIQNNPTAKEIKIPLLQDFLGSGSMPKVTSIKNTLVLEEKNMAVLRGPVTGQSVGDMMKKISKLSRNLPKSEPIYLVLDTPGGSIFDGMDFIDFLEGIPQEVKTVTLFAASMGFQIVENNPGERLIARNGTLMSHRAKGEVGGQFDGELESEYKMVKRRIDFLDVTVSNRINKPLSEYRELIRNEWWIHGFDSVDAKVADQMVLIQCGKSIDGTTEVKVQTMFGAVSVTFDNCPLIREPIKIDTGEVREDAKTYINSVFRDLFFNKSKFVKDVILTNKFSSIFK